MPCSDWGYNTSGQELVEYESRQKTRKIEELKERLDLLSRLLCSACESLERNNIQLSPEVNFWWSDHKMKDAEARATAQKQAEETMATEQCKQYLQSIRDRLLNGQLTDDEIEALGLK